MSQLRDDEGVRHVVREITRDFYFALIFVTFVAYALGLLAGTALCRHRCDECGKLLEAERPAETERP